MFIMLYLECKEYLFAGGDRIMNDAVQLLLQLGITSKYNGYWFILTALEIMAEKGDSHLRITKDIYPEVARRHSTSVSNVDRSIRTAISICWDAGCFSRLDKLFPSGRRPSNYDFLSTVSTYLHLRRIRRDCNREILKTG